MSEAVHIFAKDARALRPQILLVLVMTAVVAWAQSTPNADTVLPELTVSLTIARWYLVACAIHQERPAGDRQFWLTRPYSWRSLVAAKAALAVVWVMIPALAADVAIVVSEGLPLASAWDNLMLRQAALVVMFLLPAAAVAAITERMGAFLLAGFGMLALVIVPPLVYGLGWMTMGPLEWISTLFAASVIALVAAGIVVGQYVWRGTSGARAAAVCAVAFGVATAVFPPAGLAVEIQNRLLHPQPHAAAIALNLVRVAPVLPQGTAALDVRIEGVPHELTVTPDLLRLDVHASERWNAGWMARSSSWTWREGTSEVTVKIPAQPSQTATVRLSVEMTLYRERIEVVQLRGGPAAVPGVGLCTLESGNVVCRSATPPEDEIRIDTFGIRAVVPQYGLDRARLDSSPVWKTSFALAAWHGESLNFCLRRPVAHLRRDLVLSNLRVPDYR